MSPNTYNGVPGDYILPFGHPVLPITIPLIVRSFVFYTVTLLFTMIAEYAVDISLTYIPPPYLEIILPYTVRMSDCVITFY